MRRYGVRALALWAGSTLLLLTACQEGTQSPPPRADAPAAPGEGGSTLAPVDLVYVCGNKFLITNSMPQPAQVTYRVAGTSE